MRTEISDWFRVRPCVIEHRWVRIRMIAIVGPPIIIMKLRTVVGRSSLE